MPRAVSAARLAAASALVSMTIAGCAAGASPQASSPVASASASAAAASASASASVAAPSGSADVSAVPSGSAETSASPAASGDEASAEPSGIEGADITVTGVNYAFAGIPDAVPAGTVLGFRNDGTEVHEMAVARLNDDVTQGLPELLALPQEQFAQLVTFTGHTMAPPGEDGEATVTVDQPGTYVMLCFIPVGMTEMPEGSPGASPAASMPAGVPHALVGMAKMFSVTE